MDTKLSDQEIAYWNVIAHACRTNVSIFKYMVETSDPRILNAVVNGINLFIIGAQSQPASVKIMLESSRITDQTICFRTTSRMNGLHIACSNSYTLETIKYLLESSRFTDTHVNLVSATGCTPICYAYIYQPNSIKYFHDSGKLRFTYLDTEYHMKKYRESISDVEMEKVKAQKLNDEIRAVEQEILDCEMGMDILSRDKMGLG